jgi:hypothetical protein
MTDSDYNAIRPVESLQTIQGLTSIQRRQERRRGRDTGAKRQAKPETQSDDAEPTQANPSDEDDRHTIDYCA